MTKICSKCKEEKKVTDFNWKNKNKLRSSQCKQCSRANLRLHYQRNKTYYKKKAYLSNQKIREANNTLVSDYLKKHPCVDCGESNIIVLEFDHLDPNNKTIEVSKLRYGSYSKKKIQLEINKCLVRCANCHRIKTHERRIALL